MYDPKQEFIDMITATKADVIAVIESRFAKLENTAWEQMPDPSISEKDQARLDGTLDEHVGEANTFVEEANTHVEETVEVANTATDQFFN